MAKQIANRIRRTIDKSKLASDYVSAATAGVAFNLINVSTTASIAKGSAKGRDPAGSPRTAFENALQQIAAQIISELQNRDLGK